MFKIFKEKRKLKKIENKAKYKSIVTEVLYQNNSLYNSAVGVGNSEKFDIVISLTSFDHRIDNVYLTIESLFRQTVLSDRIILWLSTENFPNREQDLPLILLRQVERGLDIRFHEGDIGPYKKIIYALKEYPKSLIITVDDDILYPIDMVEKLYKNYLAMPHIIHCNRAHVMTVNAAGNINPYSKWLRSTDRSDAGLSIFPTGCAGVLYFPGCFHDDILNEELFLKLCPGADDIWLKVMSILKEVKCKKTFDKRVPGMQYLAIQGMRGFTLKSKNKKNGGNNDKLKAVLDYYQLWDCLNNID